MAGETEFEDALRGMGVDVDAVNAAASKAGATTRPTVPEVEVLPSEKPEGKLKESKPKAEDPAIEVEFNVVGETPIRDEKETKAGGREGEYPLEIRKTEAPELAAAAQTAGKKSARVKRIEEYEPTPGGIGVAVFAAMNQTPEEIAAKRAKEEEIRKAEAAKERSAKSEIREDNGADTKQVKSEPLFVEIRSRVNGKEQEVALQFIKENKSKYPGLTMELTPENDGYKIRGLTKQATLELDLKYAEAGMVLPIDKTPGKVLEKHAIETLANNSDVKISKSGEGLASSGLDDASKKVLDKALDAVAKSGEGLPDIVQAKMAVSAAKGKAEPGTPAPAAESPLETARDPNAGIKIPKDVLDALKGNKGGAEAGDPRVGTAQTARGKPSGQGVGGRA